jgi:hypothetical protein
MDKPVIFFLLDLAKNLFGFFGRMDFPPEASSLKVIPMEKEENWILRIWVLMKLFWQNDEKTFLLTEFLGKKCLVSDQILKLLRWFRREEIEKFAIFGTAGMASGEGLKGEG